MTHIINANISIFKKLSPTLFLLQIFGICLFSIDHKKKQIHLTNSPLIMSIVYIIVFPLTTYKSYIIADRSIEKIFSNLFQISNLIEFCLSYFLYIIFVLFSYQLRYQHVNFLNQLNGIDLKILITYNNNKTSKYYVTHQLYGLLFVYIFIVPFGFYDQFKYDYSNVLFMMCFYWSEMSTIFIMLYVRYICTVLYHFRSIVIQQFFSEYFALSNRNNLQFFNCFDELNELIVLLRKTFDVHLQLALLYNFQLVVLSLYLIGLYFWKNYLQLSLAMFLMFWVVLEIVIIVYVVDGFESLGNQVS